MVPKRSVVLSGIGGGMGTPLLNVSTLRLEAFTENTTHYSYDAKWFRSIVEKVEARKLPPEAIAKLISKTFPRNDRGISIK